MIVDFTLPNVIMPHVYHLYDTNYKSKTIDENKISVVSSTVIPKKLSAPQAITRKVLTVTLKPQNFYAVYGSSAKPLVPLSRTYLSLSM